MLFSTSTAGVGRPKSAESTLSPRSIASERLPYSLQWKYLSFRETSICFSYQNYRALGSADLGRPPCWPLSEEQEPVGSPLKNFMPRFSWSLTPETGKEFDHYGSERSEDSWRKTFGSRPTQIHGRDSHSISLSFPNIHVKDFEIFHPLDQFTWLLDFPPRLQHSGMVLLRSGGLFRYH